MSQEDHNTFSILFCDSLPDGVSLSVRDESKGKKSDESGLFKKLGALAGQEGFISHDALALLIEILSVILKHTSKKA